MGLSKVLLCVGRVLSCGPVCGEPYHISTWVHRAFADGGMTEDQLNIERLVQQIRRTQRTLDKKDAEIAELKRAAHCGHNED